MKLLLVGLLLILPLIPTVWAIFDIPRRVFETPRKQVFWLFAVATLPCVGAIVYITLARPKTRPAHTT